MSDEAVITSEESGTPDPSVTNADMKSVVDGVRSVVEMVKASPISRLRLEFGALQVEVECAPQALPLAAPALPLAAPALPLAAPAPLLDAPPLADARVLAHIEAPLVGVFYRCSGAGTPPFIELGQRVEAGQQVAIVEAMKMMNPVVASRSGIVVGILVNDGEIVEFEQHLVTIEQN